jgi:putative transposase
MFMKRDLRKRTKEEKERILLDIQSIGIVAGCRKHSLAASIYYDWLEKYTASGINGLEDQRGKVTDKAEIARLQKENRLLKEMLAEKELEGKLKDELLKKKMELWKREKK